MSKLFDHIPTAEELFARIKNNTANVSKHPWKDWNISKGEWVKYVQERVKQDLDAPIKGQLAPDFSVERLDSSGKIIVFVWETNSTPIWLIHLTPFQG